MFLNSHIPTCAAPSKSHLMKNFWIFSITTSINYVFLGTFFSLPPLSIFFASSSHSATATHHKLKTFLYSHSLWIFYEFFRSSPWCWLVPSSRFAALCRHANSGEQLKANSLHKQHERWRCSAKTTTTINDEEKVEICRSKLHLRCNFQELWALDVALLDIRSAKLFFIHVVCRVFHVQILT